MSSSDKTSEQNRLRPADLQRVDPFLLGEWSVDPQLHRIEGPSGTHTLEPKLMDLLVALTSRPRRVFSRDELLGLVWSDVVVGEEVLTRGISELRRLLGDDSRAPRYIETIRKGGYRILVARRDIAPTPSRAGRRDQESTAVVSAPGRTVIRARAVWIVASLAIAVAALWSTTVFRGGGGDSERLAEPWRPRPLTSYPGNEVTPALSPDGRLVAFSWTGADERNYDVYVLQIGDASPLRLTDDPNVDIHPVWSPDGMRLAYIHDAGPGAEIRMVSVLGGPSLRLVQLPHGLGGGFSWSPDGSSIVYATRTAADRSNQLHLLDLQSGESHALAPAPPAGQDDVEPEFSPDGRSIAFLRRHTSGIEDIWSIPLEGGEARCVRSGFLHVRGMDWTRSGESILCSALHGGSFSLWRIDAATGDLAWSSVLGEQIYTPSTARNADRLVYHSYRHEQNVWRLDLSDPTVSEPEAVITSTSWDGEPSLSPDGQHLAFTSTRSGMLELWVSASDGKLPRQITMFNGSLVGRPRWSPDGRRIAFHSSRRGLQDLYVVEVDGGRPRRLESGFDNAFVSDWSRDGRWLYFSTEQRGQWEIWRVSASDSASGAIQVTVGGAIRGYESSDGYFYYSRPHQSGLWRLPLEANVRPSPSREGDAPWLPDLPRVGDWNRWAVCQDQIILLVSEKQETRGASDNVVFVELPGSNAAAVTLDSYCRTCYFTRTAREFGDLMLVEGFQ